MIEANDWRTSSFCADGACVEVKMDSTTVLLRTTGQPERTIELTPAEWEALKAGIRNGEF